MMVDVRRRPTPGRTARSVACAAAARVGRNRRAALADETRTGGAIRRTAAAFARLRVEIALLGHTSSATRAGAPSGSPTPLAGAGTSASTSPSSPQPPTAVGARTTPGSAPSRCGSRARSRSRRKRRRAAQQRGQSPLSLAPTRSGVHPPNVSARRPAAPGTSRPWCPRPRGRSVARARRVQKLDPALPRRPVCRQILLLALCIHAKHYGDGRTPCQVQKFIQGSRGEFVLVQEAAKEVAAVYLRW
jgi:hypothetical protein